MYTTSQYYLHSSCSPTSLVDLVDIIKACTLGIHVSTRTCIILSGRNSEMQIQVMIYTLGNHIHTSSRRNSKTAIVYPKRREPDFMLPTISLPKSDLFNNLQLLRRPACKEREEEIIGAGDEDEEAQEDEDPGQERAKDS